MPIQNFPASLQPIIQQNYLEREFEDAIQSVLGFRSIADREPFPNGVGETITKTRRGLKAPTITPLNPSGNTNLDNGLTPTGWTVEQYTLTINTYGDTIDLNTVTSGVAIKRQFLENAKVNGVQSAQSLDRLARNTLYSAYLGGQTWVRATNGGLQATFQVDDIRGFQTVFNSVGQQVTISASNTLVISVNGNPYTLIGAVADAVNVSKAILAGGISGVLTLSGNILVADATLSNPAVSSVAPYIQRPNGKASTYTLAGSDLFTMGSVLDAVAQLRSNGVPTADSGYYHCYLDPKSARQLFADPDFKLLYQGATEASAVFKQGKPINMLDVKFISTTEAYVQPHPVTAGLVVRRVLVVGGGALIEGDFENIAHADVPLKNSIIHMVDGIALVTRPPLDRLAQIIAQSWYWIGGFTVPTDLTANSTIIPTANNAYYKRAAVIEHASS